MKKINLWLAGFLLWGYFQYMSILLGASVAVAIIDSGLLAFGLVATSIVTLSIGFIGDRFTKMGWYEVCLVAFFLSLVNSSINAGILGTVISMSMGMYIIGGVIAFLPGCITGILISKLIKDDRK